MNPKVLIYPKDSNPYQGLLYGHMGQQIVATYLSGQTTSQTLNNLLLPFQIIYFRLRGYNIFHLHWAYPFIFPGSSYLAKFASTIYFQSILRFIKFCGFKIIWTVHNVLPHEPIFIDDIKARIYLSNIVDTKIIHSNVTKIEMKKYGLNTDNCVTIPIGNYQEIYPNTITKLQARKLFKISSTDFVFVFLSRIEPYKGIEKLLELFKQHKYPHTKLIIAGKCSDHKLKSYLQKYKKENNIIIVDNYIPVDEVQNYFNCADAGIFPFENITTSSGVLMSLSFGKSIIAPRIGNLIDLPKDVGIFYELTDKNGLHNSIKYAINNKSTIEKLNQKALNYTNTLSWNNISDKTIFLYKKMVSTI